MAWPLLWVCRHWQSRDGAYHADGCGWPPFYSAWHWETYPGRITRNYCVGRIEGKQFGGIGDLKKKIDFYIAHSAQTHVFSFRESRPVIRWAVFSALFCCQKPICWHFLLTKPNFDDFGQNSFLRKKFGIFPQKRKTPQIKRFTVWFSVVEISGIEPLTSWMPCFGNEYHLIFMQ